MAHGRLEGKRWSVSNRIGAIGESIFQTWALARHLTPNKLVHDIGVDFLCEYLEGESARVEIATGRVFAAFVRAIEGGGRRRICLTRDDAARIIGVDVPAGVFAVDDGRQTVHFILRDDALFDRLHSFLLSKRKSLSIAIDEMEADTTVFDGVLREALTQSSQSRLAIRRAEATLSGLGPAAVELRSTSGGVDAHVMMPWIGAAFEVQDEVKFEEARRLVFGEGKPPHIGLPGVRLSALFAPLLRLADRRLFLGGAVDKPATIRVEHENQSATLTFAIRMLGDEIAHCHPSGLCFAMSGVRWENGHAIHSLRTDVFAPRIRAGLNQPDIRRFLSLLRGGAKLYLGESSHAWPVDDWTFARVIGPALDALALVADAIGCRLNDFRLADFASEEFGRSLGCLEALLVRKTPIPSLMPGFVLGEAVDDPEVWPPTQPIEYRVPIVMNLGRFGVVVWVDGGGDFFIEPHGMICGVRFNSQTRVSATRRRKRFTKSVYPELWICRDWPAVPIGLAPGEYGGLLGVQSDIVLELKSRRIV